MVSLLTAEMTEGLQRQMSYFSTVTRATQVMVLSLSAGVVAAVLLEANVPLPEPLNGLELPSKARIAVLVVLMLAALLLFSIFESRDRTRATPVPQNLPTRGPYQGPAHEGPLPRYALSDRGGKTIQALDRSLERALTGFEHPSFASQPIDELTDSFVALDHRYGGVTLSFEREPVQYVAPGGFEDRGGRRPAETPFWVIKEAWEQDWDEAANENKPVLSGLARVAVREIATAIALRNIEGRDLSARDSDGRNLPQALADHVLIRQQYLEDALNLRELLLQQVEQDKCARGTLADKVDFYGPILSSIIAAIVYLVYLTT